MSSRAIRARKSAARPAPAVRRAGERPAGLSVRGADGKAGAVLRVRLDDVDWKILRELQEDARITNVELASRVGLSPPPCLRRVRALEEAGVIVGYRTLLDSHALG